MLQFDFNSVLPERLRGNLVLPVALATACLGVGYLCLSSSRRKRLPFPPGPRGLPLVGNAFDVPEKEFWLKYKEWSDEYGSDVIYLDMFGTPVVVLNSHKAVKELLDQRSAIYSSRPNMPMLNDLIGFSWHFGFMEYGSKWKGGSFICWRRSPFFSFHQSLERRQLFQRVLSPNHAQRYRPSFLITIKTLLNQLLDDPDHFLEHGRRLSGSFILNVTYGLEIKSDDDVYILQAERGMQAMAAAGTASTFLVDFLPSLKYVPSWFPGAGFRRHAKEWSKHVFAMADSPFQYVKRAMAAGTAEPCVAVDLLEGLDTSGEDDSEDLKHREEAIRDVLAAAYAAGSDTTVSSFGTFVVAMLQNPDIQRKAQKVIDETMNLSEGLPDFTHYGKMPYIEALVQEVFRWRPVAPIAVPHRVIQDDVYEGYHIPAGATVIPNSWALAHDPAHYGWNPSKFDPTRFLNESQTAINPSMPMGYEAFGYGRRICPGLHIAVETVWLAIVSILAVFNIEPVEGTDVSELDRYTSGLILHPLPFKCKFVPRSEVAVQAVREG